MAKIDIPASPLHGEPVGNKGEVIKGTVLIFPAADSRRRFATATVAETES